MKIPPWVSSLNLWFMKGNKIYINILIIIIFIRFWLKLCPNTEYYFIKQIARFGNQICELIDTSFEDSNNSNNYFTDYEEENKIMEIKKKSKLDEEEEKTNRFRKIVRLQKIRGFWEANEKIVDTIGLKLEDIHKTCTLEAKKIDLWMTMIVMVVLEVKFKNKMRSWSMIFEKSEEYLKENGENYLQNKDKIMEIFNMNEIKL